ncbi:MAG TPA: sensor histidine kinase, partial [Luteimonas sp.]|nr:sensor histidine kinase [Luteimonas sp.]
MPRRLRYVFTLQAVTACIAVVLGLYLVGSLVSRHLAHERMRAEAASWWSGHAANPDYPLPNTSTVTGFFVPVGQRPTLPAPLRELAEGIHEDTGPDRAER